MPFLDNLAIRQAEKHLRPFMRADESLIEYDIVNIDPLGPKKAVVLSTRAIYLDVKSPAAVRVPYENVVSLESRGGAIGVGTVSGNSFVLYTIGRPKGDLYETIAHNLDRITRHKQDVDIAGTSGVTAWLRPTAEDGDPTRLWLYGDDVNLEQPETQRLIEQQLEGAVRRHGTPITWGGRRD